MCFDVYWVHYYSYLSCTNHTTPHHFPRPPTLPPKPQRMRKSRPRSIFNRKLFNGNMEAFIQVLAHLCSLSLHELSCLASRPWEFSCLLPTLLPKCWLTHALTFLLLPGLSSHSLAFQKRQGEVKKQSNKLWRWIDFHKRCAVADFSFFFNILSPVSPSPPDTELIWLHECQLAMHQPCEAMKINTWPHAL